MKSTTKINPIAFEVWDSVKEYQQGGFTYLQAIARTADNMRMTQAEVSDLQKLYQRELKNQENSKELGVIA